MAGGMEAWQGMFALDGQALWDGVSWMDRVLQVGIPAGMAHRVDVRTAPKGANTARRIDRQTTRMAVAAAVGG